ncbi:hypothetical protein [Streptomyces sp. NPDC087297]|uniref:hypothetical protein n=1 Tax=Streptomyces sp. NPDC087297 TaxID=3365778 RepID=UPI003830F4A3
MGAEYFSTYQEGLDVREAFQAAAETARDEHGSRGYTGTIAEKNSYEIASRTPLPLEEAERLAGELAETTFSDKHGPAGAIAVLTDRRTVRTTFGESSPAFRGFKNLEEAAVAGLTATGQLREGERPAYGIQGAYNVHARSGRPLSGELLVPLEGGPPDHHGWLFFGYASY